MASLKEVKNRISSVNSTRKITSAMKMVASSKLHHAQLAIGRMRPDENLLKGIMGSLVGSLQGEVDSPYASSPADAKPTRTALVLFTSNSSLCGGFNANAIKEFKKLYADLQSKGQAIVKVFVFGRRGGEAVRKMQVNDVEDCSGLLDHVSYDGFSKVATTIMDMYAAKEIDQALLVYHHFKSTSTQVLQTETFLPIVLGSADAKSDEAADGYKLDYIIEPSVSQVLSNLIPKSLHLQLYAAGLDSLASEHAARVIAMQSATDNADDLLHELTLAYNKGRQQAITTELLDIVAGSAQQ